jgi:hypothetical protein
MVDTRSNLNRGAALGWSGRVVMSGRPLAQAARRGHRHSGHCLHAVMADENKHWLGREDGKVLRSVLVRQGLVRTLLFDKMREGASNSGQQACVAQWPKEGPSGEGCSGLKRCVDSGHVAGRSWSGAPVWSSCSRH